MRTQDTDPYEALTAALAALKEERPEEAPVFAFFQQIVTAQNETKSRFEPDLAQLDMEAGRVRNRDGHSFLRPEDIAIDWALFGLLFDRLSALAGARAKEAGDDRPWPKLDGSAEGWHEGLVQAILSEPEALARRAERLGAVPERFTFLVAQAIVPFLECYAEGIRPQLKTDAWEQGCCPVCGGQPLMGRLEKELGKRELHCCLCRTEWIFKRVACPFCGTQEQDKLRYFQEEDDLAYRVEVCDACKNYLKTVDARQAACERPLPAEHLATLHLDLVAREEGFQRVTELLCGF